jgi:hypothetical protein
MTERLVVACVVLVSLACGGSMTPPPPPPEPSAAFAAWFSTGDAPYATARAEQLRAIELPEMGEWDGYLAELPTPERAALSEELGIYLAESTAIDSALAALFAERRERLQADGRFCSLGCALLNNVEPGQAVRSLVAAPSECDASTGFCTVRFTATLDVDPPDLPVVDVGFVMSDENWQAVSMHAPSVNGG